ncbi:MAG TPA: FtsX-like permease family protein [Gemmatimonadaceae bacterium]|nr:FtsX-like permease family protein [Gemmatimonadaceae bacterium]
MPSPRWNKVLRDVWLHKPRTVLVVLAIAIGITGAGSVLNTWSLLRRVTREEFRASNPPSATFRTDSVDDALIARVRALPAVGDAQARRTVIAAVRTANGPRTAVLFVAGDPANIRIGIVHPEAGVWPPADGQIAVERSSVEFASVTLGDSLEVQLRDAGPEPLKVTGIARDVGLAPGWMEHVVYGFVSRGTLARLGAPSSLNELQVVVRDRSLDQAAVRRVADDVKRVVESTGRRVADVNVPVPGRHIHAAQIDSLLFTQGAFGVLALLLSGFLVVNLIGAMLAGQVREIGVMKAVGARGAQIAGMYLGLALVLGLVASAVALPAAAAIGLAYAQFTASVLNFDVTGFTIPPGIIALQLVVGILMPVVAAAVPVLRGCRISVSEALRDSGIGRSSGSTGFLLGRASGVTRPLLLSLRNAFRRRQRMALTLLALATGGAVYLGAINLRASVVRSVDLIFDSQHYDIVLRFGRSWPADSLESALASVPGVARAEAWSAGRAAVSRPDGTMGNTFSVVAPPLPSRALALAVESGRWLTAGDTNALVVNRPLMKDDPDLKTGRDVTLIIAGRPTRWTVVGVVQSGPTPSAWVPREALARILGGGRFDRAVVARAPGGPASTLEIVQRVRAEMARRGIDVESSDLLSENRRVIEDHLLMVAGFLGVMSQLMIVVGGLGLAATMSLSVLERTREIGVMRAIGAQHHAILAMVQVEGLVIAVASWAIAIPLSVPMSVVLGRAFGRVMIPVPVTLLPEPGGVLRWLAVVVVVSVAGCAWPAFRAMRVTTSAALAYE